MTFTVTFVRHGETEFNRNDLVHGATDGGINEKGVQQAIALGKSLENETFTKAFSSDLERCRDTSQYVLSQLSTPKPEVIFDTRLREKDFGEWEGKPNTIMIAAMMQQRCEPVKLKNPGGESYEDIMARVESFFEDLLKIADSCEQDENVIVFSHGMTISCFLRYLDSRKDDLYDLGDFKFDALTGARNTSITKMTLGKPGSGEAGKRKIQVLCVYECSHLPEDDTKSNFKVNDKMKEKLQEYLSNKVDDKVKEKIEKYLSTHNLPAKQ